ncbi:unnamed protein product [Adineta steineri]|uniref:Carrier domain-containing protein n=1 Tax=Adineta steineri TaxID=433720 RepID=A0A819C1M4_9BILA|nr:unnamed protein product [Adineta steineri]
MSFVVIAPASFAQARIWLDERIRFDPDKPQIAIYNMPFIYRLQPDYTLSVKQLREALQLNINKHPSLHTSLLFDTEKNLLMQRVITHEDKNNNKMFSIIETTYETDEELNKILHDEGRNPHLFDLAQGLVFRCHLVYYKQISSDYLLSDKDLIIFNFHHAAFDFSSMNIFLHDLNQAYTTGQLLYDDSTNLRYIDYAVIEQQMSMTGASMFWLDVLHDCKLDQPLSLPYDRYRLSNEHQTYLTTSISFDFSQDLSHDFLSHASSNNISLEHLTFAAYFIFLFKLTNGQTDLCLLMNINNNRYRDELKSIIGLFENVIPLRCQLDPHWYFHQLLQHVEEITTKSMKYSYFPLQHILDQYPHISKHAFLDTSLEFTSYENNNTVMIDDSQLVPATFPFNINEDEILSVSDFSLSIHHNMDINQLSCTINASLDLFNRETVEKMSQRFHFILHQLSASIIDSQINKSIYELSLVLSNERYLMQSLNNTQISFSSSRLTCIHHEFVYQVMKHPQKLAVELDEQSLTYGELLYYVQVLSLTLVNAYHVLLGEIICQCVERSLSMVIGIMGIEMAGGVYCPLSPRDPQHRLYALTQQTQSRLVLVHHSTKSKCDHDIVALDIDSILNVNNMDGDMTYNCLSNDTVIQMTRCSFDIHVQEILGTLLVGGALIMLHTGGTIDFDYLAKRMFIIVGEPFSVPLIDLILKVGNTNCIAWNLYGPAEATIDCTVHHVNVRNDTQNIPIGRSLSNYRCMIMNQYLQSSIVSQEGELFVGGVGVFAGYLGRNDLTAKALIEIDGELFYRTGDLVRINSNGLIHYQGRKDHQIKLHGQRIELGEIERCLLNITSTFACVVIKWNDNYLVAYVQNSDTNEKELREYCQSHLPPHMIPSFFIILDKLPLNQNGKIDRKLLPPPVLSSAHLTNDDTLLLPMNENEIIIHHIWCEILNQKQISTNTNIFTIGGHSLLIMQLFHRYKIEFELETKALSITDLFQHPTIIGHAQLIRQTMNVTKNINDYHWSSLHIMNAKASFAQERIFLDEQIRFSPTDNNTNMYVIPMIYHITSINDHISISRLQHAFQYVILKHQVLRTALYLDMNGVIVQNCLDANTTINDKKSSRFSMINLSNKEHEQNEIVKNILNQSNLFNLSIGHVINCHILRHDQSNDSFTQNNDLLTKDDLILFTIHHSCFDGASESIFIRDLSLAYQSNDLFSTDDNSLQYIDYSVYEHIMNMSLSQEFWQSELKGYNLARQLPLPVDRQRLSTNQQRSGLASTAQITFDDEICRSFLNYASSHHLTLFQLGLAIFYVFLFKLSHGETALCIASINANRYRSELVDMIGMFVSTLPYRVELDPQWSFDEVSKYVQGKCLSILEHSHYPLQHILGDFHLNQSNASFLETMFDFITISKDVNDLCLNGVDLQEVWLKESYEMAKFDFSLNFIYNSSSDDNQLSCSFVCSRDLLNKRTVSTLSQRFKYLCKQIFSSNSIEKPDYTCSISISKLNLILLDEMEEMRELVFCRQRNITNEAPASYAQARIWHDERIRFDPDQSQGTIYNMPFLYHAHSGYPISINQLHNALEVVVAKHQSLRTSLIFYREYHTLTQKIIDFNHQNDTLFTFTKSIYETEEQLNNITNEEKRSSQLFNLAQGHVFRCHILYFKQISSNNILSDKDVIIFNFHHALFDSSSMNIFLHDLNQAYAIGQLPLHHDSTTLRYLDYAVIEQQMLMSGAKMFWLDILHECKLDQSLSLPYDRYRLASDHGIHCGTSISFDFGQDFSHYLITYASSNNISLEHLTLAIYFIFLFKLTNGEKDLCIGMTIDNRYRDELKSIIGLFENVIPLRCQLDPHWSFNQLYEYVYETAKNTMKYSYFPLQRILQQYPKVSKPTFLDISFECISSMTKNDTNEIILDDSKLSLVPFSLKISENEIMSNFDFIASFQHNLDMNELSCTINGSLDLFNTETVIKTAQRFHSMINHLFISMDNQMNKPIYEISLTLSTEQLLLQSMNNTQVSFPSPLTCIHHEFVSQVMKHPQKLAVELDEQSLTYCELLHCVQLLSLNLLNEYHVSLGDVICQCVERSLSMVIGIMAIEMAGGVYCPLSPRDPPHRLHALIQQTDCHLILAHYQTKTKFNDDIISFDIGSILTYRDVISDIAAHRLSNVTVTADDTAYIIFTSGSTGMPKGVQVRHRNLMASIDSLVHINLFSKKDTMIQMASCSYDVHVQEIIGALTVGATIAMLHLEGNMDIEYVINVLSKKGVSYLQSVPAYVNNMLEYVEKNNSSSLSTLRTLDIGGEKSTVQLIEKIHAYLPSSTSMWNSYGPAETTVNCTCHVIDKCNDIIDIPIGRSLPNYRCLIMDKYQQSCVTDQDGELFVGGAGVFSGYLGRDDLSAKALIDINGQLFYRTGDLVRMDDNGLFHYIDRKDFQIKLHGQRIELGEIEQCLLRTSISACVVIKWNDDHLIAYVQSSDIDEKQLRDHCESHLPPHMTPSLFVILDKLPLNVNGKIDRKLLPPPNFASIHLTNPDELLLPVNENEIIIHHIWCDILKQKQISTNTNIFSIGGHSLVIMQLFYRYKSEFHLETNSLSITDLFQHSTIIDHAQLIYQTMTMTENISDYHWSSLHIIQAKTSFAQERIFLDEQIRFSSTNKNTNMYVIPLIYRISSMNGHISISRLQHAFQSVILKHQVLRTALYLDTNGTIIQHCLDANAIINDKKSSRFSMINLSNKEHEQNEIVKNILNQSNLFNLSIGHVINCHILRHDQSNDSFTQNNDLLTKDDLILFTIHHSCFDGASESIFIRDLSLAYQSNDLFSTDDNSLQYIDYSVYEHIMNMSLSQEFWQSELKGYNLARQLPLPVDRQRLSTNQQRSGLASTAQITFDDEICRSFLNYASSHHLTLFQLGLAIFYVFLFKLSHGETALCIASINANRYRSELVDMIGMFVSTLPYRVELDPQWSFDEVSKYVQGKCLSILEHSHYPLQHILGDFHLNQSNASFLETMFDFITISKDVNDLCLNGVDLQEVWLKESYEMAKFDFSLNFIYNSSSDDNQLSCSFVCSRDLLNKRTVSTLSQRFKYLCKQIFSSNSIEKPDYTCSISISKLNLILLDEMEEMRELVFCRQRNITNEAPASYAQARIWHDERIRFDPDQSQGTIYNMPFLYHAHSGYPISINQLHNALEVVVAKHQSLRTSLIFYREYHTLTQKIIDFNHQNDTLFTFTKSIYETEEQLNNITNEEKRSSQLFNLAQGHVFRCHILYFKQISSNNILSDKDVIIFNFHHALFDSSSMNIFLHDLNQAYAIGQLPLHHDSTTLRYLDYAVIEQQMLMSGAKMFWLDILHECKLDQSLSLPYDRYRLASDHGIHCGTSISFDFGQDFSHYLITYASSNNISLEHLTLAIYFIFLFKLTNGEKDLCIGMTIDNRYRDELKSIIGLFENVIPLRCQLDPHWSFNQLYEYVYETAKNTMKYSYFPLQRILQQYPKVSKPTFLDISFECISSMTKNDTNEIILDDSKLSLVPFSLKISENEIMSNFDFIASFQHNLDMNELSCTINGSLDLFNTETVIKTAQRFHSMINHLFISMDNQMNKPIYEISLTLSTEQLLLQSMNNTQVSFPSPLTCIHHEFVSQVMKHPQKLAVELDEQSLTYCELLHCVQLLSLNLLNEYHVSLGDVICQCVERSLSMVIGIMAIEMAGGVYCPLSPRDPPHRLHALIQQTDCHLILAHYQTKTKFNDDIISFDIGSILTYRDVISDIAAHRLSNVTVTADDTAYIIFTSGSTGIPKPAQLRHRNLAQSIRSLVLINLFNKSDTVVQIARCSFDIHIQEIIGTIIIGACLVNSKNDGQNIPLGMPLPNYRCIVQDNFDQPQTVYSDGELLVSGAGIFAGYLERDDLTARALVEIDGELFYRTGDLVKTENNGLLHYQGRKDYQIKLHGQRIELGEIERCLLNITSVFACVVMKWNDDYLVAYVQSSHMNEEQLRQHCQSHLPPHMIPSFFIILDKLPLNANGKIDRKLLPSPDFLSIAIDHSSNVPSTALEQQLQQIFSQVFHIESPPLDIPLGQLGGTSLDAIRALILIRQQVYTNTDISFLFTNPSIRQLALAIEPLLILNRSQETVSAVARLD